MSYTRTSLPQYTATLRTADTGVALLAFAEQVALVTADRGPGFVPIVVLAIVAPLTLTLTLATGSRIADAAATGNRPRRDDVALALTIAAFALLAALHAGHWLLAGALVAGVAGVAVVTRILHRAAVASHAEGAAVWAKVRRTRMGQPA